jgi:hypothetical protein
VRAKKSGEVALKEKRRSQVSFSNMSKKENTCELSYSQFEKQKENLDLNSIQFYDVPDKIHQL